MEIPPSKALDMNRRLYLTIGYLLKNKQKDLKFKFHDWLIHIKG